MVQKDCPFCGAPSYSAEVVMAIDGGMFVKCKKCGARGPNRSYVLPHYATGAAQTQLACAEASWDCRLGQGRDPGPSIFEQVFGKKD